MSELVNWRLKILGDFETLSALHKNLRHMMKNSVLMNFADYVRDVEKSFRRTIDESTFGNV